MSTIKLEDVAPTLKQLIRLSSTIAKDDISFYNSIDSNIKSLSNESSNSVIELMNNIVESTLSITPDLDFENLKFELGANENNANVISNVLDCLFENVEISLDNHKKQKINSIDNNSTEALPNDGYTYLDASESNGNNSKPLRQSTSNISKPQLKFIENVNNFEIEPFKPLIKMKPNSLKSFEESIKLIDATETIPIHYPNPYEFEILNQPYPEWIFDSNKNEHKSIPWEDSKEPIWIDDPQQLDELLCHLKKCKVIAIDLEHHDFRTYHGLTSLMQISTDFNQTDYLIDPLSPKLRPHLTILNEVFTDPNIIKVLHGAFMDVIWLQRDLGLYLVSLFDTFHASKALLLKKNSLAFLLEKFVKFRTSKKWQLADWRLRPLSKEMKNYAMADTHFLIEVFWKILDEVKKIDNGDLLKKILFDSRKVANRRFEYSTFKPFDPNTSKRFGNDSGVVTTNQSVSLEKSIQNELMSISKEIFNLDLPWTTLSYQNGVPNTHKPMLEILFKWRDQKARKEDESTRYVMSDFTLIGLVNEFTKDVLNSTEIDESSIKRRIMSVIDNTTKFATHSLTRRIIPEIVQIIIDSINQLQSIDIKLITRIDMDNIENSLIEQNNNKSNITNEIYNEIKNFDELNENFDELVNIWSQGYKILKSEIQPIIENKLDIFAIGYTANGESRSEISQNDKTQRIFDVVEQMRTAEPEIVIAVEDENINEEEEEEIEQAQKLEITQKQKKIEKEEIITLKRRQPNQNRKLPKAEKVKQESGTSTNDLSSDFLDFSKNIMENANEKKRKREKSKQFDPYSDIGGNGKNKLKKRKMVDRGRNTVFKKK
ncbi:exosome nuclease subunit [Martiniozyma asiatica (nom. inval.)]|nr:exosome nuclease subunit [Martiniozyma asiatica]